MDMAVLGRLFYITNMAQIDDFFMYENRVEGITDADYQRAQPYVEAAQAFAQTTYQSIYIIDYYHKNFLYVSDNPLFLCGHTADEVRQMGYGFYLSHVPEDEVPMLTELNRSGFRAFYDELVENRRQCMMSYDFHITHGERLRVGDQRSGIRLLLVNHKITPLAMTTEGRVWLALALAPQGGRTHRVLSVPYGREARVLIGGPPMEESRDHHPEARGEADPDALSTRLHHEGDSRTDAPLVRHCKVLPPPDFREARCSEHHRSPRPCYQLRPRLSRHPHDFNIFCYPNG